MPGVTTAPSGHPEWVTDLGRALLHERYQWLQELDTQVKHYDQRLERLAHRDEVCQRLRQIEGVRPLTAPPYGRR